MNLLLVCWFNFTAVCMHHDTATLNARSCNHRRWLCDAGQEFLAGAINRAVLLPDALSFSRDIKSPPCCQLRTPSFSMPFTTNHSSDNSPYTTLKLIPSMTRIRHGLTPEETVSRNAYHAAKTYVFKGCDVFLKSRWPARRLSTFRYTANCSAWLRNQRQSLSSKHARHVVGMRFTFFESLRKKTSETNLLSVWFRPNKRATFSGVRKRILEAARQMGLFGTSAGSGKSHHLTQIIFEQASTIMKRCS
jgi:hypothetical protein